VTGQIFVLVTHDPLVAAQTEHTVVLHDGRLLREELRNLAAS
jgi:ABC-type lipoprotein export system ATPase subunit